MNYLAHFHIAEHLAGSRQLDESQRQGLIIGALLGDYIKGPLWRLGTHSGSSSNAGPLDANCIRGIALHRRIDVLTDQHPELQALSAQWPSHYRRYRGIMLDICCDHWLAKHWEQFSPQALSAFSSAVLELLLSADIAPQLPEKALDQAQRLQQYQLLSGIGDWAVATRVLAGIGLRLERRNGRDNPLGSCADFLARQRSAIEAAFLHLYPELLTQLGEAFATDEKLKP